MHPVVCQSCKASVSVGLLSELDTEALQNLHHLRSFSIEMSELRKVRRLFERHPEAEDLIKPDFSRMMESEDVEIQEQLSQGVPFDKIDLPAQRLPAEWLADQQDAEAIRYLQRNEFSLTARMDFVTTELEQLGSRATVVKCPHCSEGQLYVPPELWEEFVRQTEACMTYYWLHWHRVSADGTVHVKCSSYEGQTHSSGEMVVETYDVDYAFWRWLIVQPEHQRLVEGLELERLRDEWSSRMGQDDG